MKARARWLRFAVVVDERERCFSREARRAVADRAVRAEEANETEWCGDCVVERRAAIEIRDAEGQVIEDGHAWIVLPIEPRS